MHGDLAYKRQSLLNATRQLKKTPFLFPYLSKFGLVT